MSQTHLLSNTQLQDLQHHLEQLLRAHPAGLGEYELLKQLQQEQQPGFPQVSLCDKLPLFQMHFLLFHLLYALRDRLWQQQRGDLRISSLNIQLQPYQAGTAALSEYDALRDYYLTLEHLYNTTEAQVQERLDWFWQTFLAGEQRPQALQTLELTEPVDYPAIKQRYRQLAAQHHPDRGGDKARFQAINQAMDILQRYYASTRCL